MTEVEMKELLDSKKLTLELALEISIKKWKELPEYWEEMTDPFGTTVYYHWPSGDNCALCWYGIRSMNPYPCVSCPLKSDEQEDRHGTESCAGYHYIDASTALENKNKKEFMRHRNAILKRLQRALEKERKRR